MGCSPGDFAEKGGVDIGVEDSGDLEGFLRWTEEVDVRPIRFRRGGDVAIGGGFGIEIGGAEGADGEGLG